MSGINSINSTNPVQKIVNNPIQKQVPSTETQSARAGDRVELSGVSHLLQSLKANDIRADKVATIKAALEAGTYESDDKLNAAVDRLLDDVI